jgi:hypothetical protein
MRVLLICPSHIPHCTLLVSTGCHLVFAQYLSCYKDLCAEILIFLWVCFLTWCLKCSILIPQYCDIHLLTMTQTTWKNVKPNSTSEICNCSLNVLVQEIHNFTYCLRSMMWTSSQPYLTLQCSDWELIFSLLLLFSALSSVFTNQTVAWRI